MTRQGEHKMIFNAKLSHFVRLRIIELLTIVVLSLKTVQNKSFFSLYIRSKNK